MGVINMDERRVAEQEREAACSKGRKAHLYVDILLLTVRRRSWRLLNVHSIERRRIRRLVIKLLINPVHCYLGTQTLMTI